MQFFKVFDAMVSSVAFFEVDVRKHISLNYDTKDTQKVEIHCGKLLRHVVELPGNIFWE